VSKLRTSSLRSGAFTEDEEEDDRGGMGKKRSRNRGRESNVDSDDDDGDEGLGRVGKKGFRDSYNSAPSRTSLDSKRGKGGMMRGGLKGRERDFGARKERDFGARKEREREFGARDRRDGGQGPRGGGRIGRVENGGVKRAAFMSDEEEDEDEGYGLRGEKTVSSFIDLIGEEDSEDDTGEEEEEHEIRSRSSLFANEDKKQSSAPANSPERVDSYLSETRLVIFYLLS